MPPCGRKHATGWGFESKYLYPELSLPFPSPLLNSPPLPSPLLPSPPLPSAAPPLNFLRVYEVSSLSSLPPPSRLHGHYGHKAPSRAMNQINFLPKVASGHSNLAPQQKKECQSLQSLGKQEIPVTWFMGQREKMATQRMSQKTPAVDRWPWRVHTWGTHQSSESCIYWIRVSNT